MNSSSLEELPLSPPPPGVKSNFNHPESQASLIYIAAGICLPLISVFIGFRFYAKFAIMKKLKWDDLSFVFGLLAEISYISMTIAAVDRGSYGVHEWDISVADFTKEQAQLTLILSSTYGPSIWLVKLAIFVLYLEVFGLLRWLRHLVFAGIFITGVFYITAMVIYIALCAPRNGHSQASYFNALASPRCSQALSLTTGVGVFNVVSDLYLILIPLPAVWSLQLPLRRKIGLAAMFLTGSIACIASIFGLIYRIKVDRAIDTTWNVIPTWITTIIEFTAGTIVCCMPSAVVTFKTLKIPVSSFFATYVFSSRALSSTEATVHDKQTGSFARLYHNNEVHEDMHKPWSGPEDTPSGWQLEHASATAFPLGNTKILKTTEIDVERSSARH